MEVLPAGNLASWNHECGGSGIMSRSPARRVRPPGDPGRPIGSQAWSASKAGYARRAERFQGKSSPIAGRAHSGRRKTNRASKRRDCAKFQNEIRRLASRPPADFLTPEIGRRSGSSLEKVRDGSTDQPGWARIPLPPAGRIAASKGGQEFRRPADGGQRRCRMAADEASRLRPASSRLRRHGGSPLRE